MSENILKLVMPKNVKWMDSERINGVSDNGLGFPYCNVKRRGNSVCESSVKGSPNGNYYKDIHQQIKNVGEGVIIKRTVITPYKYGSNEFPVHKTIERLSNDGFYSVTRLVGDEIVGGYEMHSKPQNRTFAQGFKGKLQKAALAIGTDANGCEKPVLRRVASFMFDMAKKIK